MCISQEELDTVLYGYAKSKGGDHYHGHALSGLNLSHALAAGDPSLSAPEPVTFGEYDTGGCTYPREIS